jgi:uncharacterized SAM-binding protein YcdF (DUF218 family)
MKCLRQQPADAIVMLLGSTPERELEVADLFKEGYAPLIIMAEFRVYNHELIEAHGLTAPRGLDNSLSILNQLGVPPEAIHITPGDISSTRGEAIAVATYLQQNPHIKSIILVSSPSHMRRATMVFRREFRRGGINCVIIPRASKYSDFQEKRWWKHRDSAIAVASEYAKLLLSR